MHDNTLSEDIASRRTICFPINRSSNEILLGMKLEGFGKGKYNGFGGKLKTGETPEQAAKRELSEESGLDVSISDLEKIAIIDFIFPFKPEYNQLVHVYFASKYSGSPKKTDEMNPKWFSMNNIPYRKMWDSDRLWLRLLIEGGKIYGKFFWKEDNETVDHYEIQFLDAFK